MAALIKEIKRSKIKIDSEALDNWNLQISKWREKHGLDHDLYLSKIKSSMIDQQVVVQELYHATQGNDFVTSDVGQHQMFVAQKYHYNKPRRWNNSGRLGTKSIG